MINLELVGNAIKIPKNRLIFKNCKINSFEYIDILLLFFFQKLIIMKPKVKY